jgi:ATP-dependent Lhr-like helicase
VKLSSTAGSIHEILSARGAMFPQELGKATKLLPAHLEMGLTELIAQGLLTCDSYGALRWLIVSPSKRKAPATTVGRWSLLPRSTQYSVPSTQTGEFLARQLLRRTGVVFRKTIAREKQPIPWRDLVRVYRALEARGEIRGGRFVAGFDGEQYALPEAVSLLRAVRRRGELSPISVSAADPLNFRGILTPDERVAPAERRRVTVG